MPLPEPRKFENREIMYRNFAGKERQFNAEGDRNFCLKLTAEEGRLLAAEGWNVKQSKKQDPYDEDEPYLPIALSMRFKPSKVVMLTTRGRTTLTEDMYMFADWVDIYWVDLTVRPFAWSKGNNHGVKAYLQTIYVKVREDDLDLKYQDIPEVGFMGQDALEAGDPNIIDYDGPVEEYEVRELER